HDGELRASTVSLTPDAHRAAELAGQLLHQREPDPHPTVGSLCRLALDEGLEDPLEVTGGNACTRIADQDLAMLLERVDPDGHPPARLGELQRIVQEIAHHLAEALAIDLHPRALGALLVVELDSTILEEIPDGVAARPGDLSRIEAGELQHDLSVRQPSDVQQVVHQA